jgi:hypothetical protein
LLSQLHIKKPLSSHKQWVLEIRLRSDAEMIFSGLRSRLAFIVIASKSERWKGRIYLDVS